MSRQTDEQMWNVLQKGDYVLRNIEGVKFAAKVLDVYYKDKEMKIQYIDDNNVEDNVSFGEAERVTEEYKQVDLGKSRKDTLQKPLIGLFEDDHEIRKNHKPTVLIHDSKYDTHEIEEEAIILNGAENRLAAGGGLRALRYLKK